MSRVFPPENQTPEGWLGQLDDEPTIVPEGLPASERMALVMVAAPVEGTDTYAFYIRTENGLNRATHPSQPYGMSRLFFVIPLSILQRPGICPDLEK